MVKNHGDHGDQPQQGTMLLSHTFFSGRICVRKNTEAHVKWRNPLLFMHVRDLISKKEESKYCGERAKNFILA